LFSFFVFGCFHLDFMFYVPARLVCQASNPIYRLRSLVYFFSRSNLELCFPLSVLQDNTYPPMAVSIAMPVSLHPLPVIKQQQNRFSFFGSASISQARMQQAPVRPLVSCAPLEPSPPSPGQENAAIVQQIPCPPTHAIGACALRASIWIRTLKTAERHQLPAQLVHLARAASRGA
jgi:hypothetical protein